MDSRKRDGHWGAWGSAWGQQIAAKRASQIAHGTQTDAGRCRRGTKTGSVVSYLEREAAALLAERHAYAAGIGMLNDVGDAFLRNQINGAAHFGRRLGGKLAQIERSPELLGYSRSFPETTQSFHQRLRLPVRHIQPPRDAPHLFQSSVGQGPNPVESYADGLRRIRQRGFQQAGVDMDASERLSHSGVQLAAQPLALRCERIRQHGSYRSWCAAGTCAQVALRFEQTKVIARSPLLHERQVLQFPAGEQGVRGCRPGVHERHLLEPAYTITRAVLKKPRGQIGRSFLFSDAR